MKILYVTTISNTMEFFTSHINMLLEQGHTVDMACNLVRPINYQLLNHGCKAFDIEFQRAPTNKNNYIAYKKLKKLIQDEKYDLVHTHTPVASVCARLACRNMKNVKVLYTAHGFHFFKGASLKNWLLYYSIERWLARHTDMLITINKEDYARAKKSFKAGRVEYIPGVGLDTKRFSEVVVDKSAKRKEIRVPEDAFVLLSVGELNKNKNHETVIKAVARLNNPNVYYVICGQGPLESHLRELAKELGLENQVKLLGFRRDIIEICKAVDIFVFPSYREGLPVALMEAMASGLPVICSNVRGNKDLIEEGKGGYLVEPNNTEEFQRFISLLQNNFHTLRLSMGNYNKKRIKIFDQNEVIHRMKKMYSLYSK